MTFWLADYMPIRPQIDDIIILVQHFWYGQNFPTGSKHVGLMNYRQLYKTMSNVKYLPLVPGNSDEVMSS